MEPPHSPKFNSVRDNALCRTLQVSRAGFELFDYLEVFYNGQRRHSALGYLSPRVFEQRHEQDAVAT